MDGTHFAGRIVATCGGWAYESARVYVYNTHTNRWAPFPSLNRIRRDQAAEFIPLASDGIGIMMMWGGRSGSDSNVLTTPEYYFVGAGGCPVLLVDDDWAAYWPTGGYEGPYDDAVTAASGAYEPLIYGSSGQANSTRYGSGSFKTVYLAFPLEWVNTVQERAQILGAALRWMCPIMEPTFLPLVRRG